MYFRRNVSDCWTDGNIVKDDGTLLQVESDHSLLCDVISLQHVILHADLDPL